MFGYIKPNREEMKVKEYNTYKAVYCGLCKCMGRCVSAAPVLHSVMILSFWPFCESP